MNPKPYHAHLESACIVCGHAGDSFNPIEIDHIKTRGSGGSDESFNVWTLCRTHHVEKHYSLNRFVLRWPKARAWLIKNGWEFDEFLQKWRRYKKEV